MDENEYWPRLEYRVSAELAGMAERRIQYLWCDGFTPTEFVLTVSRPRVTGRAWICNGPRQEEWGFTLWLPRPYAAAEEIEWETLLPPETVTRWLSLDEAGRRIEIDPASAVPDSA